MLQRLLNKASKTIYIFKYMVVTSWTGKLENVNGRVIRDLNHLLTLNVAMRALGFESSERDLYLTVRR